jgi:predicted transcriptional regulator
MDINVLADYTIYQIKSIFQRVLKLKNYDATVLFKTVDGKINIDHFAEEIDMFKSPFSDIFKSESHHSHIKDSITGRLGKP